MTEGIKKTIDEALTPISRYIKELAKEISHVRTDLNCLKESQPIDISDLHDHGFILPLKGSKEFDDFEEVLAKDDDRREKIASIQCDC